MWRCQSRSLPLTCDVFCPLMSWRCYQRLQREGESDVWNRNGRSPDLKISGVVDHRIDSSMIFLVIAWHSKLRPKMFIDIIFYPGVENCYHFFHKCYMKYQQKKQKYGFVLYSRDVNVNMVFPLERAKCTVYDRLTVCVCLVWFCFGGRGLSFMAQYGSSMSFELVGQEC